MILLHSCVVLGLLALSVTLWSSVWVSGHPSSTIVCGCGDPGLNLWFLEWVPWSITHLHNPFLSNAIYAGQGGANTLDTDSLFPGLVTSPITLIFGPVTAFNVLVTIVPVINGWSMFLLLRKLTRSIPGALIGSVVYGFSPYVVGHDAFGHFNAAFLFFPTLTLWCAFDLLVDRRHRPVSVGLALGILAVIQFFTGPELLAMSVVIGALGVAVALVVAPRLVWDRRRDLATALGVAGALALGILAYPVWFLVFGPRHITGFPWPHVPAHGFPWDSIVHTGTYPVSTAFDLVSGYFGPLPSPTYMGWALLVLLVLLVAAWRRRRLAWCTAAAGVIAWVLSLGTGDRPLDRTWFPWRLFDRLPLVNEILPSRFSLFLWAGASVLIAISLEQLWASREVVTRVFRGRAVEPVLAAFSCAVVIGALVPVAATYGMPFTTHFEPESAWFQDIAPHLRPGTILLAMPDAASGETQLMAWQALEHFSFNMIGGYALVPGADGQHSNAIDPPGGAAAYLVALSWGFPPVPTGSIQETRATRAALEKWGVQIVVVSQQVPNARYAAGFLTAVLGRLPQYVDGAWVWYGLGHQRTVGLGSSTLYACEERPDQTPLAMARCVLSRAA